MDKENLLNILKTFIDWLTHYYIKFSKKESELSPYNSLSPTDDAENIDYYIESLNWALLNKRKIKNIAISGPYGSGKSSVIQTFQKKNNNKDFRFLNISLATFKEINTSSSTTKNEELLRLIELSILQQFFYHEKDDKIPDSRFKKIKSNSKWFLRFQTIFFISFLISFLYLVFPEFLGKFSLIDILPSYQNLTHSFAVVIFVIGLLFILFKVTRIIKSIVIKKLSINNASIEIDDRISKSILNNHLDEILYFFEVTKYNIVIIEDIDRFEQTEVFTKLRELNLLINNSKKTKEDIVFIYAIRDDMFKDKERTKFFDFMIPIIPVINSSNSSEKLLKIIKENQYKISNDLVSNISLFIDDMRLLFNIMNEYHIYSNSLNTNLNQDKLLSMIVYKNMHPIDFTDLSNNKGSLYSTLTKKQLYIQEQNKVIDSKISKLKENITKIEDSKLRDIKELRRIYLSKIIEKIILTNPSHPFYYFWANNSNLTLSQATEDENFNAILNSTRLQYAYNNNQGYRQNYNLNFESLEKEINPNLTYKEREEIILSNDKLDNFKRQIEEFEEQKNQNKKLKIKELLSNQKIEIEDEENKQNELINILLRNGYIDESYIDYISIFYEGSLSKSDYQFLINIKTQKNTDFDFKLNKIDNLISKINILEFEKQYVLNYSLLDFLISNNKYKLKNKSIFTQLKNQTIESINFIDGFIDNTSKIEVFIKLLCQNWTNIWRYLHNESDFSEDKKEKYFKLIIEHADKNDIKKIFGNYKSVISNNPDFLTLSKNKKKLKDVINILNIKFKDLSESSPKDLLEFIYSENYYSINTKMVIRILTFYNVFDQQLFKEKNYTSIQQSEIKSLIEYIDNNIDEYITSVYLDLKIEPNDIEPLENLLNNDGISIENKSFIIKQSKTEVENIDEIKELNVKNILLKESKMSANWYNIFSIYNLNDKKEFSQELIDFMNKIDNAKELSGSKINKDFPDEISAKEFIRKILLEESFNNDSYQKLLKSVPYIYNSIEFDQLTEEKVKLLIANKILVVNDVNFSLLRENFDNIHVSLLEINPKKFIENKDSFNVSNADLLLILKSNVFTINQKVELINLFEVTIFITDVKLLNQIGKLLNNNLELNIAKEIIDSIMTKSELLDIEKIKVFNKYSNLFDNLETETFINTLKEPYLYISENGKRPLIDMNEINENFVKILLRKNYVSKYDIEKKGIRISTFRNK
jgi:hypothetical protein